MAGRLLAYHDRSDGGLLATLTEMMFAGGCGVTVLLDDLGEELLPALFTEELGAVLQVRTADRSTVLARLSAAGLGECSHVIGTLNPHDRLILCHAGEVAFAADRIELRRLWSETSYQMQALRDHPDCAYEAFVAACDPDDPGLQVRLTFDPSADVAAPYIANDERPRIAILREHEAVVQRTVRPVEQRPMFVMHEVGDPRQAHAEHGGDKNSNGLPPSSTVPQHAHS